MAQFGDLPAFNNLKTTIADEKEVFYFSSEQISSDEPHNFICIKRKDDVLIFMCTTSQGEKRKDFLSKKGYSLDTLVEIPKGSSSLPFTKDTFVDCNKYHVFSKEYFSNICNEKPFKYRGKLEEIHYQKIIDGLHSSDQIDDEFKESLPPSTKQKSERN